MVDILRGWFLISFVIFFVQRHVRVVFLYKNQQVQTKMTASVSRDQILAIGKLCKDESKPLKQRYRGLFTLKNLGGKEAIDSIGECFQHTSALFKHECAYVLGQMQDSYAVPILRSVLEDHKQETIVRHEAGKSNTWISTNFGFVCPCFLCVDNSRQQNLFVYLRDVRYGNLSVQIMAWPEYTWKKY